MNAVTALRKQFVMYVYICANPNKVFCAFGGCESTQNTETNYCLKEYRIEIINYTVNPTDGNRRGNLWRRDPARRTGRGGGGGLEWRRPDAQHVFVDYASELIVS